MALRPFTYYPYYSNVVVKPTCLKKKHFYLASVIELSIFRVRNKTPNRSAIWLFVFFFCFF